MKRAIIIILAKVFVAMGFVMYVPVAGAQQYMTTRPGGRAGNWEFTLPLIYTDSAMIKGQGGSSVHINSDWNTGFGFGYNINDHFQVNGLFTWAYRGYDATTVQADGTTRQYSNYMNTSTLAANGVFYLLDGPFTPFISGGIGYAYVNTNIPTGVGNSTCYWDPWYGYICTNYVPTKTENDWSYSAGIGVRFDASRQFALQASYNKTWLDIKQAEGGMPEFDLIKFDFIFRM